MCIRDRALHEQGRRGESAEIASAQLARDPEDAMAHYNRAYAHLSAGEQEEAEAHFLESLRLDSSNEAARIGMMEAIRARSELYRRFLRAYFWLRRGGAWGGIIRALAGLVGAALHAVATLLMLPDRRFRQALDLDGILLGILGGGSILLCLITGILSLLTPVELFGKLSILCGFLGAATAMHLSDELPHRLRM